MAINRIIKNTTGSPIIIENAGLSVPASGQITISFSDLYKVLGDSGFETNVNSGNLVINDGTSDLSATVGLLFFKGQASELRFNNASNSFPSSTIQATIEDVYALQRFAITTTFNGSIGNNTWLGYSELLTGNNVPILVPKKAILREITFSYTNTQILGIPTGSNLVDGTFQLFINNQTTVTQSITFTNQASPRLVSGLNIAVNAGDWFLGRWIDQGDNPSDLAIVYFFQPVF